MPNSPNRLSRFWQELKRRKVIYVITVYASAAFVIIELVNNVVEPLNLPERTPTIVIVILAIGFPITIILSWIFDLTPKGVEKTKPLGEEEESEMPVVQNRWKIATYISLVVIIGLIILNLVGGSTRLRAGDIQSLVILPFENYTGDDQLEYFVSGMHASLIQDMGRISGYRVVNRTSSNVYKNVDMRVHEIASELDADAAIEADVMCLGDSICLQIRVIRAFPEEEIIWIADYKEDRRNILKLYNLITKQIAEEVKVELTEKEETLFADARTVNKDAYDYFLKGKYYWDRLGEGDLEKALEYFNRAMELDPNWAPPYSGVALVYAGLVQMGFMPYGEAMIEININLDKAIELDPDYPGTHFTRAGIGVWFEWDWKKGEGEFLKALEINPNDVMSRIYYAHLLMILKRYDEAHFHSQMAVELDPMNPLVLALSASVDNCDDRVQQAIVKTKKALEIDPENHFALLMFEGASYLNGDFKNAIETDLKISPGLDSEAREAIMAVFQDKGYVEAINTMLTYLEEYARSNYIGYNIMGEHYWRVGNLEKLIECYIKAYEMHDPNVPYCFTQPANGFDDIKDDPRIIAIVEKMNLPLPKPN